MNLTRRDWLKFTGGAALAASLPRSLAVAAGPERPLIRDYEQPMFDLPGQFKDPVVVESVEMLRQAYGHRVDADLAQHVDVLREGALHRQHADPHGSSGHWRCRVI